MGMSQPPHQPERSAPRSASGRERLPPDTPESGSRQRRLRLRLFIALVVLVVLLVPVLGYAAVWTYRFAVAQLGPFAPLAVAGAGALLLAIGGPWLLIRYRRPLTKLIGQSAVLAWALVEATGLPNWFRGRFPRLSGFLAARLAPGAATGLGLTISLAVAGALLVYVMELLVEVVLGTKVVAIDRRSLNLIATVRTPELDRVMYAASYLGAGRTIVILLAAAVLVALLARRWLAALLFLLAPAAAELFMALLKLLVHRPRPPLEDARIVTGGFSFPSGHATLAATFYGTLAFLLIRRVRAEWLKALIGIIAALVVLAVGVSRVYLGVHYPTDVLAGWALGVFWLVVVVLVDALAARREATHSSAAAVGAALTSKRRERGRRVGTIARMAVSSGVVLLAVGAATFTYQDIPPVPSVPPPSSILVASDQVPQVVETHLRHVTETLTGKPQEPISLVLVGSQTTLERAFVAAGWTEAAPFGFQSVAGGISASLSHRPDNAGPVTPSFLAEEPDSLAFSQPVGATFAKRHHIRIWSTHYQTTSGQNVWLATASFDEGFELAPTTFLPTHRIAPDIDTERGFVVASLTRSDSITQTVTIQLVPPEQGHNFSGDPFYTDGQAFILYLRTAA